LSGYGENPAIRELGSRFLFVQDKGLTDMRYIRLYLYFLQFSLAKFAAFRFDFFARIAMDTLFYASSMGIFQVIFLHADQLGGWDKNQVMFFMSLYFVVDALAMITTAGSMWNFPKEINKGGFDYYLLRPVSTIFFACFRDINLASIVNLAMALGLLGWSLGQLSIPLSVALFAKLLIAISFGYYFFWIMHLMVILPVFWTHSVDGVRSVYFNLLILGERPDGIYRGFLRKLFVTAIPFSLIASIPARLIFDESWQKHLWHLLGMGVIFAVLIRIFWARGLRAYSSASS
jgi:ABC-2 type transport system permease protein